MNSNKKWPSFDWVATLINKHYGLLIKLQLPLLILNRR